MRPRAAGGFITRNGEPTNVRGVEPKTGAFATEDRNHTNGGLNNRGDDAEERYREGSGVTSGNPICEPIFVNGAEPGDTLQVEVLHLKTADFGCAPQPPPSPRSAKLR